MVAEPASAAEIRIPHLWRWKHRKARAQGVEQDRAYFQQNPGRHWRARPQIPFESNRAADLQGNTVLVLRADGELHYRTIMAEFELRDADDYLGPLWFAVGRWQKPGTIVTLTEETKATVDYLASLVKAPA